MVHVGDTAPTFALADQFGTSHSLSSYTGRYVLLYFYPKDATPGCTVEACAVQDEMPNFDRLKTAVFGISADTVESHARFSAKQKLTFPLLSDPDKSVIRAYGVWGRKSFMGRTYMGIRRMSFLISPEGKIAKVYDTVKPRTHAEEVIQDIEALRAKKKGD